MNFRLLRKPAMAFFCSNMTRRMCVAIVVVFGTQHAYADTATEVSRFLKIYRIGEMQRTSLEFMLNDAVKDKKFTKQDADCVLKDLSPKKLAMSARPMVSDYFKDEKSLKAVNDFFAGKLGQRILDHGSHAQASAMKDVAAGREPAPMPVMSFTPDEIKHLDAWEKSTPYAEFKRFVAEKMFALETIGNNDFKASIGVCQGKDSHHT